MFLIEILSSTIPLFIVPQQQKQTTTTEMLPYQLLIESTATVPKTVQFEVLLASNDGNPISSSKKSTSTNQENHVKLTISHGNVFHPYSKLTILLSKPISSTSTASSSSSSSTYHLKIGENNLFEEDCHLILHVQCEDNDSNATTNNTNDDHHQEEIQETRLLVGSYNQFAPKCQVYTNQIGNGNLFHPFCNVQMDIIRSTSRTQRNVSDARNDLIIGNGNIFNAFVSIHETMKNDDYADGARPTGTIPYHNQVFFLLSSSPSSSFTTKKNLMRRTNDNGVRKNMADITLLQGAMKTIIQAHHQLMPSTT